jgi:hypothetical protein
LSASESLTVATDLLVVVVVVAISLDRS